MIPSTGDDLPIFDEAPLRAVDFAPREVGPPGRRGPIGAVAWTLGLVAIVALGLFAGSPAMTPAPREAVEGTGPPSEPWPPQRHAHALGSIVKLESPAPARTEVTTRRLEVSGSMLIRAARVEIALEAREDRVLDQVSVDVLDPDGGIRPDRAPRFAAIFDLPFPRPNGTMWVVVTAFDEGGLPLGSIRRAFDVGPLLEAARRPAAGDPPTLATGS